MKAEKNAPIEAEVAEVSTAPASSLPVIGGGGGTNSLASPLAPQRIYQLDTGDIDVPWLNVVQKSSALKGELGAIIHDKEVQLAPMDTDLLVIPLEPKRGWKEDYPFESDNVSRFAWTPEEKEALLADTEVALLDCAELTFFIPAPSKDADESVYMFPIGDSRYALGRLFVQKDGLRQTYKRLNTFNMSNAMTGIRHTERQWMLRSELMEKGRYKFYVPRLTVTSTPTPPELLAFVLSL